MADVQRLSRGGQIRRPKKKVNLMTSGSAVLLQSIQVVAAHQQNFCVPLVTVVII